MPTWGRITASRRTSAKSPWNKSIQWVPQTDVSCNNVSGHQTSRRQNLSGISVSPKSRLRPEKSRIWKNLVRTVVEPQAALTSPPRFSSVSCPGSPSRSAWGSSTRAWGRTTTCGTAAACSTASSSRASASRWSRPCSSGGPSSYGGRWTRTR